jgi:hypothetical protein
VDDIHLPANDVAAPLPLVAAVATTDYEECLACQ